MTTTECMLQFKQWPRRQRQCNRRKLDRLLNVQRRRRLSAWRKFLVGQWQTGPDNEVVNLVSAEHNGRKSLEWRAKREGKMVRRFLRIRIKHDNNGKKWEQFALAGGSDKRVQLWMVSIQESTDNVVIWKAHNSSYYKLKDVQDIVYTRVKMPIKRKRE